MASSTTIEVKLQSLKDQTLNTGVEKVELVKDEIFRAKFKNQMCVDNLIALGGIVQTVPSIVALSKKIPVILPPVILHDVDGNYLPLTSVISQDEEGNYLPLTSEENNLEVEEENKSDLSEFFGVKVK